MIFGTYKLHNAENETMSSLCHYNYINLYFAIYTAAPTLQYKNTIHSMQYSIKTTQSYYRARNIKFIYKNFYILYINL